MQRNLNSRSNPLWRKIATITFLPIIILIWTTGWVLTQIGPQGKPAQNKQKTLRAHSEFEATDKESKISDETDESPEGAYEQQVTTYSR